MALKEEDGVSSYELEWMVAKRPLVHNEGQLKNDYPTLYNRMIETFAAANQTALIGALQWPGVGTRWREYLEFIKGKDFSTHPNPTIAAFVAFSQYLGRVRSYRALALTDAEYQTIVGHNSIFPSGRLRTDSQTIDTIVNTKGIYHISYARLYIGLRLLQYDPSLSLHDDGETAVCIASGYMKLPSKRIHLMEMNIPKIEALGYRVVDLHDDPTKNFWFDHRGVMFDARLERTERYMLFEIPFLRERMKSLRIFSTSDEVSQYLQPFSSAQQKLFEQDTAK